MFILGRINPKYFLNPEGNSEHLSNTLNYLATIHNIHYGSVLLQQASLTYSSENLLDEYFRVEELESSFHITFVQQLTGLIFSSLAIERDMRNNLISSYPLSLYRTPIDLCQKDYCTSIKAFQELSQTCI